LGFSKLEFDPITQVGGDHPFNSVSPLSLWEREPIFGLFET
jgi:hypothetical protein